MAVVTAFLHTCGVVVFPYIDDWLLMALLQESLRGSILLTLTLLKDSPLLITPYPLPDSEVHRVVYQYFNLQGFSASRRGVDTLPDGCKSMISWQGPSLIHRDCYPICFSTNVTFQLWFMRTFRPHRKSQRTILSIPPRARRSLLWWECGPHLLQASSFRPPDSQLTMTPCWVGEPIFYIIL